MGKLCDDMTRLRGEIDSLRDSRVEMRDGLSRFASALRGAVSKTQSEFRAAHNETSRDAKNNRCAFVSGLCDYVSSFLGAVREDLQGVRMVWGALSGAGQTLVETGEGEPGPRPERERKKRGRH
ncbi:MAG: hypothetical protein RDV41_11660 [Planctomycetota bacterium]|nr:hypothetical protein [Planctomycetota bacterium]